MQDFQWNAYVLFICHILKIQKQFFEHFRVFSNKSLLNFIEKPIDGWYMPVTTVIMVILLLFGSAISKALLKARFEKLDESYATKIFFKFIIILRKLFLLLISSIIIFEFQANPRYDCSSKHSIFFDYILACKTIFNSLFLILIIFILNIKQFVLIYQYHLWKSQWQVKHYIFCLCMVVTSDRKN